MALSVVFGGRGMTFPHRSSGEKMEWDGVCSGLQRGSGTRPREGPFSLGAVITTLWGCKFLKGRVSVS